MRAIWQARGRVRATVPELGGSWITQRPPAHGLAQLHNRPPLRRRHNGCFSKRHWCGWSGSRSAGGYRLGRHRCRRRFSRRGWLCRRGRVRRVWLAWARRARPLALALSKTKPMRFTEHGVSGQATPQLCRDLAGAQALSPELFEALDPLLGPGQANICHHCLQSESLSHTDRDRPARAVVLGTEVKVAAQRVVSTHPNLQDAPNLAQASAGRMVREPISAAGGGASMWLSHYSSAHILRGKLAVCSDFVSDSCRSDDTAKLRAAILIE